MIKKSFIAVLAVICLSLISPPLTTSTTHINSENNPIVKVEVIQPKKKIKVTVKFKPWNKPSVGKVFIIAKEESKKWGANYNRLLNRIECESTYRWYEEYVGHHGLGQFVPSTFERGMDSIGTRKVVMKRVKTRKAYSYKVTTFKNGRKDKKKLTPHRQKVKVFYKGTIPRHPEITHGWAQVRLMARAMVGLGNVSDSEWACR